jgi:proteasome lid subunit RPN8/RPN11
MKSCLRPTVLAALLGALSSHVANAGACEPISFGPSRSSADEAAIATLQELIREGLSYESGGFVIKKDGVFRSSKPVTQRSRTAVNYCIALPRGASLAAIYHTHVGDPQFSTKDRHNADRAGVPSYIGTIRGAELSAYDPTVKQARALGLKPSKRGRDDASADQPGWLERLQMLPQRLAALFR